MKIAYLVIGMYLGYVGLIATAHWMIFRFCRRPANNRWSVGKPGVGHYVIEYVLTMMMPIEMTKGLYEEMKKGLEIYHG